MLAWTPLLKDIKEYSPQLKIHLDQSHNDLKARKLHRTTSVDWTNKMNRAGKPHRPTTYLGVSRCFVDTAFVTTYSYCDRWVTHVKKSIVSRQAKGD